MMYWSMCVVARASAAVRQLRPVDLAQGAPPLFLLTRYALARMTLETGVGPSLPRLRGHAWMGTSALWARVGSAR